MSSREKSADTLSIHSSDSRGSSAATSPIPPFEEKKEETATKGVKLVLKFLITNSICNIIPY